MSGALPHPASDFGALRTRSLIVTIIGDLVMDEGRDLAPAPLAAARLGDLLGLFAIDAGAVRASLSRLVADGTLLREKFGRNTYYRLAPARAALFSEAAGLIYGRATLTPTGAIRGLLLGQAGARAELRDQLTAQGWRMLAANLAVRPEHRERAYASSSGAVELVIGPSATLAAALRVAFDIDRVGSDMASFLRDVPIAAHLDKLRGDDALRQRILLVHQHRRLQLRDPHLPDWALPPSWPGADVRVRFAKAMEVLRAHTRMTK